MSACVKSTSMSARWTEAEKPRRTDWLEFAPDASCDRATPQRGFTCKSKAVREKGRTRHLDKLRREQG